MVSRGGRPDLAGDALRAVEAPTLLIVGGNDEPVIGMNQTALAKLKCPGKKLVILRRATHLSEEPGASLRPCQQRPLRLAHAITLPP
jgi:putative phosphoribosyl transferase